MLAEIQCLPSPPGTATDRYKHVEAAIAVLEGSGLPFEVGALGTTVEGEPDAGWAVVRRAHEACLTSGASGVVCQIKVAQRAAGTEQVTIAGLTDKFRNR